MSLASLSVEALSACSTTNKKGNLKRLSGGVPKVQVATYCRVAREEPLFTYLSFEKKQALIYAGDSVTIGAYKISSLSNNFAT